MQAARPTLACLCLCVPVVVASAAWYSEVLEVEPTVTGPNFAMIIVGGTRIEFAPSDEKNPASRGGSVGYLHVAELKDWIAKSEANGATVYWGPFPVPKEEITICQMLDPLGSVFGIVGRGLLGTSKTDESGAI